MKRLYGAAFALALMAATPIWASTNTIWGGFEDTVNTQQNPHQSDYDYNDLVFSMTGSNLTLVSTGVWHSPSGLTLGTSGSPFWNNSSFDGANDNVGFCIYGGPSGSCGNHSAGFDPGANYLATAGGGSVNDVYFSVSGNVAESISVSISADSNALGWALVSSPSIVHAISGGSFTPTGNFELVGIVNGSTDYYYSDYGRGISQFAFFESTAPTPEPGSLMLLGSGLLGIAGVARRRFGRK